MADLGLLAQFDGLASLRNGLKKLAVERDEWAGIPMPIEGMPLIVEPTYPRAELLMKIGAKEEQPADDGTKIRNVFWSWRWRSSIAVFEGDGKITWGLVPRVHHLEHDLSTLGASDAWGIEQEAQAVQLLGTLLRHRQFKQYMLTGMFMEKSERSGVHYIFRRLKPTVALSIRTGETRVLCSLCLHPIAYYSGSWAGAMCPTDDVIAHLMLMRGDEAMFWRRANQHPAFTPEAGL